MTVRELVAMLNEHNPDAQVIMPVYNDGTEYAPVETTESGRFHPHTFVSGMKPVTGDFTGDRTWRHLGTEAVVILPVPQ